MLDGLKVVQVGGVTATRGFHVFGSTFGELKMMKQYCSSIMVKQMKKSLNLNHKTSLNMNQKKLK